MSYKHNDSKRHHFKKHTYRLTNHSDYNQALKNRGRINVWLSDDILKTWQNEERTYDGTDSTEKYPDSTIEACHYLRMVFKLPLRQAQGFTRNAVYQTLEDHFPNADIVIPPKDNTFADDEYHPLGIIDWQRVWQYGKRNISEI